MKQLNLKQQIRIAIGSAALICSLGYTTGAFAVDSWELGWELVKNSIGISSLANEVVSDINISKKIEAWKKIQNLLSTSVKTNEKKVSTLAKGIEDLNKEITKHESLLRYGFNEKTPTQYALDSIEIIKKDIQQLNLKIDANIITQTNLTDSNAILEAQKLKIADNIANLDKTFKFQFTTINANDLKDLKSLKALKDIGTIINVLGYAATTYDIYRESQKISGRIQQGSTNLLENLNLYLKGTDYIIPSLPCFESLKELAPVAGAVLCSSPSDLGRYIIDYQSALKSRNKSFLNGNEMAKKATTALTTGDANIDQYILRKLKEKNTTFTEVNLKKNAKTTYENLRKDYMDNHFSVVYKNLRDTKKLLTNELDASWLDVSKEMFTSFINGIDIDIAIMDKEVFAIWQGNKGLATVYDYAVISATNNHINEGKKTLAISNQADKLQLEIAQAEADKANQLTTTLKNISVKVDEIATPPVVKPTPPVTVIPTVKLTGTVGDAKVTLKWNKPANTINQAICYSPTKLSAGFDCFADGGFDITRVDNQNSPAIVDKLTNGKKYYFVVTAENTNGSFANSSVIAATPKQGEKSTLNDTGITTCSDNSTNGLACPINDFTNQDAQVGRDKTKNDDSDGHAGFSFTKISSSGKELSASATEWNCVKDNVTGLTWEIKTTDGGLHDMNNYYTWYEPDNSKNGGNAGTQNGGSCKGSDCDTNAYVKAVNAAGYCGYKDWRMPTRQELVSIVDFSRVNPAIDTTYFPNTKSYSFWSSSLSAAYSNNAWNVYFDNGYSNGYSDNYSNSYVVRLVR